MDKREYVDVTVMSHRGEEIGSRGGKDVRQDGDWRNWWARQRLGDGVIQKLCADKPGGTTGEQDRPHNPGFQHREIKP